MDLIDLTQGLCFVLRHFLRGEEEQKQPWLSRLHLRSEPGHLHSCPASTPFTQTAFVLTGFPVVSPAGLWGFMEIATLASAVDWSLCGREENNCCVIVVWFFAQF